MGKSKRGKRAGQGADAFYLSLSYVWSLRGHSCTPFSTADRAPFRLCGQGRAVRRDLCAPIQEDKNGEVYTEAFREYWAGNGKAIWIENDRVFGFTMKEIVEKMAKARGIKENAVKALDVEGEETVKAEKVKGDACEARGEEGAYRRSGICLPKVPPALRLGRRKDRGRWVFSS